MDEKQSLHHRQHFNLSESAKQMLEQLTTQRYPGRQRRQSQVVEDLITEAFTKEQNMATVANDMQEPEGNDWLAPETREAVELARQEALRLQSPLVYPEHLLLGVIAQGNNKMDTAHQGGQVTQMGWSRDTVDTSASGEIARQQGIQPAQSVEAAPLSQEATSPRLCPSCKKETRSGWKHCVYCGASLAKQCPHCGAPSPEMEGARFCFECGKPLK